ncbi:MAG: YjgP/YjgQ family permease [Firmicutes bacterium]|nr:YjgP/YjgQ family permease [Bacillota bacterium]
MMYIRNFPRTLDRYIIREFLGPFFFCVIGFTVILLSGLLFQLSDLIFVKHVPAATVGRMLLYKIPGTAVLTLPIAVLFATLLSLGRLVQDSEVTVMRGSGIAFPRLIVPVILLGLAVSAVTYWASEEVVPWANHQYENTLRRIVFTEGIPVVQENVFFHGGEDRYFYIGEVSTKTNELHNILVYELGDRPFPNLITAKTGMFQDNVWVLFDGISQELDEEGFVKYETRFGRLEIITEQEAEVFLGNQRTTDEMNRRELKDHIERFQRGGLKVPSFVVDYHMKLALPMSSFIFALFGAPMTLRSRAGRSFGVALSLVVLLFYYVAVSVSRSLGANEVLPPLLSAWIVNVIFAVIGLWLIVRSDQLR